MDQTQLARASFIVIPLILPGRRAMRWPLAIVVGAIVALGLAWGVERGDLTYMVSFSTMAMIYALLSLGLNSQWGLAGHVNFGVAGFFAVGAFTSALVTTTMPTGALAAYSQQAFGLDQPFLVGVIVAGLVSAAVGYLVAIPVLRLRTDFLAIATLGIAEIVRLIFQNERWLANGPQPLRGIPQPLECLFENPAFPGRRTGSPPGSSRSGRATTSMCISSSSPSSSPSSMSPWSAFRARPGAGCSARCATRKTRRQ
jgi:branched-chain amino acid transport system permease protein